MKAVQRSEILDYVTYNEEREAIRAAALAIKQPRRLLLGEHFVLLFENRDTVRYQIQEMMRTERIVREADIQHELDTYNELLGPKGTLCATLLIGIDDEAARAVKLRAWLGLLEHLYVVSASGERLRPTWDPRQVGEERLSAVQYLSFALGEGAPLALGVDWPAQDLVLEVALSEEQRAALQADLDGD